MQSKFTIGIFGIILNKQNKILLCHRRDYDLWNLPGGGLEKNESIQSGLIREVKEETGLAVKISRLAGVYSKPYKNEIVFSFVCEPTNGKITLNEEADKIEYFEINKLPTNIPSKQKERIKDVFKNPETTILKTQNDKSSIELIGKIIN